MGCSRQEYWRGLLCPPPGDLPHPGIEPASPALQVGFLPTELHIYVCVWGGGGASWWLSSKEYTCNAGVAGDMGLIPGWGRSPGGEHGDLLQCSHLENLHGQRSLVCYSPQDHKESDTTEVTQNTDTHILYTITHIQNRSQTIITVLKITF